MYILKRFLVSLGHLAQSTLKMNSKLISFVVTGTANKIVSTESNSTRRHFKLGE